MPDSPLTGNFNPDNHPPFSPIYSHVSQIAISPTATLVSIAGQIGCDMTTKSIPNSLGEQVALALKNVDACLAAAGATKQDIVQVRQYIVNFLPQDPKRVELYTEWLGDLRPPSTNIGCQSLAHKDLLYEIEVVCVVKHGS